VGSFEVHSNPPQIPPTAMHDVPANAAQMAALFVESILYGAYLVTFMSVLSRLLFKEHAFKPISSIRWPTLLVACLLFSNGTFNLGLAFLRQMQAYVYKQTGSKNIAQIGVDWVNIVKVRSRQHQYETQRIY